MTDMTDMDDTEFETRLRSLRYRTPPMDQVWTPDRVARRSPFRLQFAVWIAVAAALTVTAGVVAAGSGWFDQFVPSANCAVNEPACGAESAQVAIIVDTTTDVTALEILVKPGLSQSRLREIAAAAAAQQKAHRVIVYVLKDLPAGAMSAGFGQLPADDAAAAPPPSLEVQPFLMLTYDRGPNGAVEIWP